ncbi:MAG: MFS transporter [Defluviitaleaceae bacterium]|nr:MFS transporter [Defluviitaleaceae bacterium]
MLLIILYAAFVGLGLPAGLLGAAWPVMQVDLAAPVYMAGVVSAILWAGTIFSTLMTDKLTRMIRPGYVVAGGLFLIIASLFGFSLAGTVWLMFLWAVPLGLGSGAVDAVINNYIAVNYSSRHMNWVHCFWGAGAMAGPFIMGFFLDGGMTWNAGYLTTGIMVVAIFAGVMLTQKLWKPNKIPQLLQNQGKNAGDITDDDKSKCEEIVQANHANRLTPRRPSVLRIRGVKYAMLAFFAYCSMEGTAMLWAATFLVYTRGISAESVATFSALVYIGLTAGRVSAGFISNKIGDRKMVHMGLAIALAGIILIGLPFLPDVMTLAGLAILGLGCAPIFPTLMHATPAHFGEENSQALVGIQMASAYVGLMLVPPLFGMLAGWWGTGIFAPFLFVFFVMNVGAVVALNKSVA